MYFSNRPGVFKSRRKREGQMRASYKLISALFAIALLAAPAQAQKSGTYTGKWGFQGVGQTYEIGKGHVFFVGMFHGVFFNDVAGGFLDKTEWTCPGVNDIVDGVSVAAHGYCVATDKDGDKVFVQWQEVKGTDPEPEPAPTSLSVVPGSSPAFRDIALGTTTVSGTPRAISLPWTVASGGCHNRRQTVGRKTPGRPPASVGVPGVIPPSLYDRSPVLCGSPSGRRMRNRKPPTNSSAPIAVG
jgi:hypothetical protein